ncbi:MAG: hypothetical protein Kow00127_14180 [Bacteroidales bacterium]
MKLRHALTSTALLIFLLSSGTLPAQTFPHGKEARKARNRFLMIGTGLGNYKSIDYATSPLLYSGTIYSGMAAYEVESFERVTFLRFRTSYGALKSNVETPWFNPRNLAALATFSYNTLFRLNHSNAWYLYLGPLALFDGQFRVNTKYGNSALTFNTLFSAGLSFRVQHPFEWKATSFKFLGIKFNRRDRKLALFSHVNLPVYNILFRPTYVTITNFIVPEMQMAITPEQIFGGTFSPLAVYIESGVSYYLQNNNALRFSYEWSFLQHNAGDNKIQSASHLFSFGLLLRFNPVKEN